MPGVKEEGKGRKRDVLYTSKKHAFLTNMYGFLLCTALK